MDAFQANQEAIDCAIHNRNVIRTKSKRGHAYELEPGYACRLLLSRDREVRSRRIL